MCVGCVVVGVWGLVVRCTKLCMHVLKFYMHVLMYTYVMSVDV